MRQLRASPRFNTSLQSPLGDYGDENVTADSISSIITTLNDNMHFLSQMYDSARLKVYGIDDISTTQPPTTNFNQAPVRVDRVSDVFMSSSEGNKLVTINYNRQTYVSGTIKFALRNNDDGLKIGSYVYAIDENSVKIMIQRTGEFYGYGSIVLELLNEDNQLLASTIIGIKCDPLNASLGSRFTRGNAWMPNIPEQGTAAEPAVLIKPQFTQYNVNLTTKVVDTLIINVTLKALSSVKISILNYDTRIRVTTPNEYIESTQAVPFMVTKTSNTGLASFDVLLEGYSPTFGYVSTLIKVYVRLDSAVDFPTVVASIPDIEALCEVADFGILNTKYYEYQDYSIELSPDVNNVLTIPEQTIIIALKSRKPIRYDKIYAGLSKYQSDALTFENNQRPAIATLSRVTQVTYSNYNSERVRGYVSYYVGKIPATPIKLADAEVSEALISVLPEVSVMTPVGLGTRSPMTTKTYKFRYRKAPS